HDLRGGPVLPRRGRPPARVLLGADAVHREHVVPGRPDVRSGARPAAAPQRAGLHRPRRPPPHRPGSPGSVPAGRPEVTRYLLRRFASTVVLLFVMAAFVYVIFYALPSDPAVLVCGKGCGGGQLAAIDHKLGLDQPEYVQFWHFLEGIFV